MWNVRALSGAALIAFATTASAQCNDEIITATGWDIELISESPSLRMKIDVSLQSNADHQIRMVDGSIVFSDVLGGSIGSMAIDRDLPLATDEAVIQSGMWGQYTFERLLDMLPDDVVVRTCVRGVVYANGEVVKFGG